VEHQKIQAVNNFTLILRDETETEKNGLFIPDQGVEKPSRGKVVSVGDVVMDKNIKGGEGKIVIFHKGNGFDIDVDGITYLVLEAEKIIAVL